MGWRKGAKSSRQKKMKEARGKHWSASVVSPYPRLKQLRRRSRSEPRRHHAGWTASSSTWPPLPHPHRLLIAASREAAGEGAAAWVTLFLP